MVALSEDVTNAEAASVRGESAHVFSEPIRIVHLTDLHYGRHFNDTLWQDAANKIIAMKPRVILVTGDLVDSPFRWYFSLVRRKLETLRGSCQSSCLLYVIPGNHDTRLFGLFPVVWLVPLALAILSFSAILLLADLTTSAVILGIAGTIILIFRPCVGQFNEMFRDRIPRLPCPIPECNLVLYPFDSATSVANAACGVIKSSQFVDAHSSKAVTDGMYKIALLHHHSLPIPYNSAQESMLVLANAGAFLSEAARLGVRLILSGHKHHQHFSRVTINAETPDQTELCVLNTGSPTAGKVPGTHGYNFSVIDIHRHGGAKIVPYHSEGGTFGPEPAFWTEGVEASGKALLRETARLRNCECKRVSLVVEIGPDGDGRYVSEVRGFRYIGPKRIDSIPGELRITVGTGQIERLQVTSDSPGSPIRDLNWSEWARREQRGQIRLTRRITNENEPFDFTYKCYLTNGFAMSAQQARNMYPEMTGEPVEFAELGLARLPIPTAEATMLVKLPEGFVVQGDPWLSVTHQDGSPEHRLEESYRTHLLFHKHSNVIFVRLPFAPLGPTYRLMWKLCDAPPPAGQHIASRLRGTAAAAEAKLQRLAQNAVQNDAVSDLLSVIESRARDQFKIAASETEPLSLDIMVFNHADKKLRVAAANYSSTDPRWRHAIDYGDGIAGRAYKMNRVSLFLKAQARIHGLPYFYALATGEPISEDGNEIPDEALLSLPLCHPEHTDAIFGILNISSRQATSSLVDITEESVTRDFRLAASRACMEAINELDI